MSCLVPLIICPWKWTYSVYMYIYYVRTCIQNNFSHRHWNNIKKYFGSLFCYLSRNPPKIKPLPIGLLLPIEPLKQKNNTPRDFLPVINPDWTKPVSHNRKSLEHGIRRFTRFILHTRRVYTKRTVLRRRARYVTSRIDRPAPHATRPLPARSPANGPIAARGLILIRWRSVSLLR